MIGKRGFTLIEVMVTMVAGAFVIGATASLYGFVAARTADAVVQYNAVNEVQTLYGELSKHISTAVNVEIEPISGVNMLKLTLPQNGVDKDGDGIHETWNIVDVNKIQKEVWGIGVRVWYYTSDSTGIPGRTGTFVFRAKRMDDASITASDVDRQWSFLNGTTPRMNLPGTLDFVNTPVDRVTRVRVAISGVGSTERTAFSGTKAAKTQEFTADKRFYWRAFDSQL